MRLTALAVRHMLYLHARVRSAACVNGGGKDTYARCDLYDGTKQSEKWIIFLNDDWANEVIVMVKKFDVQ